MKKIITALFVCIVAAVMTFSVSAFKADKFTTSNDMYGFKFEITEEGMNVSGCVYREKMAYLIIRTTEDYMVNISPEIGFKTNVKLPESDVNKIDVGIYVGQKIDSTFIGLFFGGDIILEKADGKWSFVINDSIYNNNNEWRSGWIDPTTHLDRKQPDSVKFITANVTKEVKGNYAKAEAIHQWVADNIYYDKDYALNTKTYTSLTPTEVLTSRVSVCEGYANLTVAMLNAAGIPAVTVKGYSLGFGGDSAWSEVPKNTVPNHMWVEAYVDGKWIIMDPTWDSKNMYNEGKKEKNLPVSYRYFDMTPEMLAMKHKILDRPNLYGKQGVSSWAEDEVRAAYSNDLLISDIRTTMKDKITREEFCDLVINFLNVKYQKTTEELLEDRGLQLNPNFFVDTFDYNILAANALGIVNGKENNCFDPYGFITRQEAAVMLQRTAKVMGITTPNEVKFTFADAAEFPSWSAEAIDFVSASVNTEGRRVMGGVENNKFNPKGHYTKEQSVLTIYRLFTAY